jgi:hypothetical protein
MSPRELAALALALTVAGVLFVPISGAVTDGTGIQTVTNESVTADVGNHTDLEGYDIDGSTDTVTYTNGTGTTYTAVEGSDYELATENGSIKVLSGGNIDDGASLKVSYDYQATSGTVTTVVGLVPLFVGLLLIGTIAGKLTDAM